MGRRSSIGAATPRMGRRSKVLFEQFHGSLSNYIMQRVLNLEWLPFPGRLVAFTRFPFFVQLVESVARGGREYPGTLAPF